MHNANAIFVEKRGHILCVIYIEEFTFTSVVEDPVIYLLRSFLIDNISQQ